MDGSAREIVYDENGVCNFCHQAQTALGETALQIGGLFNVLKDIWDAGDAAEWKGGKYDCLIGLSGGVDSSFLLHKAMQMGLRPLCFSVDNGWNDPKADENILRMVETLKVPFYRYTIDIPRFRELQAAFMKAGLPNLEIPTDHILMATTFEMAARYGIKHILSGGNVATESIMPPSWGYSARDLTHIKAVFRQTMGKKLTGLPVCGLLKWNWYRWVKGIKTVYLLDYLEYNRNDAARILAEKYGWQEYGQKHCESVFTHWFQSFYLFEKFGFDKRKAHFSSLINSGQMTKAEALLELQKNPEYPELGIEQKVMKYPKRSHDDFPKDEHLYNAIARGINFGKILWKY